MQKKQTTPQKQASKQIIQGVKSLHAKNLPPNERFLPPEKPLNPHSIQLRLRRLHLLILGRSYAELLFEALREVLGIIETDGISNLGYGYRM